MGTRDDYWLSGFGDYFENIVEFEATGIDKITINLEKAGTLPDRIGKYYQITNLKIIGEINGTDLRMIREMARSGKLSVLDLSKAKIIEGGDCYYNDYYTSNDVIGSSAFLGCSGLTSLNLPAGITSIGDDTFLFCSVLTSLTLPASITSIGSWAFQGCSGLTSIYVCAEKVPEIGSTVFEIFDAKKRTLYVPMGTRDDYRLSDFRYYFENIVEFEATEIDKITINLEKAGTLPDRIASSNKYKITNLKIIGEINGTDLRMIREMAKGNSIDGKLCVLDLSEAKIVEGGDWYYHENYIDNYYTHNDEIGGYAFHGCSGLTSLNLPAGITVIDDNAFYGCSGLTSIYVYAEKVPKIGSYVFAGVDAKKCTLYVPMGTRDNYRLSKFGYFENIVEFDATGIDKTTTSTDVEEVARYSVNGQRLSAPTKGLNIVKYSDGSVKKVAIR